MERVRRVSRAHLTLRALWSQRGAGRKRFCSGLHAQIRPQL